MTTLTESTLASLAEGTLPLVRVELEHRGKGAPFLEVLDLDEGLDGIFQAASYLEEARESSQDLKANCTLRLCAGEENSLEAVYDGNRSRIVRFFF